MSPPVKEPVVVVGFGWVGQANALALKRMGHPVYWFDLVQPPHHYPNESYDGLKQLEDVSAVDTAATWYVVCVGDRVDAGGQQDISSIKAVLDNLFECTWASVVLRSTVLPGLIGGLQFDYYVPEFLHEQYGVSECLSPPLVVVGERKNPPGRWPSFLQHWRAHARKVFVGTPEDAAAIKYLINLWNAVRIAFVNEFGDAVGDDVSNVHDVINFVFERAPYLRYGQAFGGHCLPKDSRAFARWYSSCGPLPFMLLSSIETSNLVHQKRLDHDLLPQWFSDWS